MRRRDKFPAWKVYDKKEAMLTRRKFREEGVNNPPPPG